MTRLRWLWFPVIFAVVSRSMWGFYLSPRCDAYLASHPSATSCAYQSGYIFGIVCTSTLVALVAVVVRAFLPGPNASVPMILGSGALAAALATALQIAGVEWRVNLALSAMLLGATVIGCMLALLTQMLVARKNHHA